MTNRRLFALVLLFVLCAAGVRGLAQSNGTLRGVVTLETSGKPVHGVIVTILAGPLNYAGVNPKVACHVPQPSK